MAYPIYTSSLKPFFLVGALKGKIIWKNFQGLLDMFKAWAQTTLGLCLNIHMESTIMARSEVIDCGKNISTSLYHSVNSSSQ